MGSRLSADTKLEAGRAPVDELNGLLGLDGSDSVLSVFGTNIAPVQQTARHIFALLGVALDHLITLLEASIGHVQDRVLLVLGLIGGDERRESGKREVDAGERDQVGLELVQINVKGASKTEGGGDGRDDLRDETVEVGEARKRYAQVLLADVEDGLVVNL